MMAKAMTTKRINTRQLQEHLGADTVTVRGNLDTDDEKEIEVDGMTASQIQQAIDTYAHDADYGRSPSDQRLIQVRAKAQAVIEGSDTFTVQQMQNLVARLVLRELGEDD